jgi:hypothetical protein
MVVCLPGNFHAVGKAITRQDRYAVDKLAVAAAGFFFTAVVTTVGGLFGVID